MVIIEGGILYIQDPDGDHAAAHLVNKMERPTVHQKKGVLSRIG